MMAPGLLIAAFVSSVIQRVAGMGFGIAMSSFTLALYEPFVAIYVSAIIGFGVTIVTMVELRRRIVWRVVWPILPPSILFMCLGFGVAYLFGDLPLVRAGFQTFGLCAIALALNTLLRPGQAREQALIARPWIGGSFTGFLSGTVGMPGPTIAPYFFTCGIVGIAFVATITPIFFLTSSLRMALGAGGDFTRQDIHLAIMGAVLAVAGVALGSYIGRFVPERAHRWMILILIFISAGRLILALINGLSSYFLSISLS